MLHFSTPRTSVLRTNRLLSLSNPKTMNSTPTTTYLPLTSHSEIRLLLLKPGPRGSPIECSLIHTEIGTIPYEALAYEWGTQKPNEPTIYISDTLHETPNNLHEPIINAARQIRNNLHDALSRIRLLDEERWLWVEALCINQADNGERTHQVGIMGRIYESANMVIAWSGEGNEEDMLTMRSLRRMSDIIQVNFQWRKRYNRPKFHEVQATIEWCEKSYWSRVWIVQELILARNLTLMVGSESIPGESLISNMAEVVRMVGPPSVPERGAKKNRRLVDIDKEKQLPEDLRRRWENTLVFRLLIARRPRTRTRLESSPGGPSGKKLCDWIFRCRDSECMDPRDHVYGLLGVSEDVVELEDGQLAIEVDYEKSLLSLYYDVARFWVAQYGWSI